MGTVTYLVVGNDKINQDSFRRIVSSRNVPQKLFQLADTDKSGDVTVNELMEFLVVLSAPV